MKKSIRKFEIKKVKNSNAVKGGNKDKGCTRDLFFEAVEAYYW